MCYSILARVALSSGRMPCSIFSVVGDFTIIIYGGRLLCLFLYRLGAPGPMMLETFYRLGSPAMLKLRFCS